MERQQTGTETAVPFVVFLKFIKILRGHGSGIANWLMRSKRDHLLSVVTRMVRYCLF